MSDGRRGQSQSSVVVNRHSLAQFCFLTSGALALVLFGGAEPWAMATVALTLATACAYEAVEPPRASLRFRWPFFIPIAFLGAWMVLSLCPWPVQWAPWLAPGQARLLAELPGFLPKHLHLSMAPRATWLSLFAMTGAATVIGLSWRWSAEALFRQRLGTFILGLGVAATLLAALDHFDNSDLIWGIRATRHPTHWGAFISRNHLANYLNFAAIIGLGLFLRHYFPRGTHRGSRFKGLLALGGTLTCIAGSLTTTSKGGLLSLAVGLGAFMVLLMMRKRSRLQLRVMVFGVLLLVALTLVYARPVVQRTEQWIEQSWGGESEGRWRIWSEALTMSRSMKGRGIGIGAFETVFPAWQVTNGRKTASHAESEYVQMFVEWGPAATLAWVALGIFLVLRATRTFRGNAGEWQIAGWAAMTGMAVHAAVDFPFHMPANAWLACAVLGMLLRGHAEDEGEVEDPARSAMQCRLDRLRLYSASLILLASAALGFTASWAPLCQARNALNEGHAQLAHEQALRAVRQWPFSWRAHQYAGFAAAALPGRSLEAQRHLRRAVRLAQANPMVPLEAGLLFVDSAPSVAQGFFETAIWCSDMPSVTYSEILSSLRQKPALFAAVLQVGLARPNWWAVGWEIARGQNDPRLLESWTAEGADAWLGDPLHRMTVIPVLLDAGRAAAVLSALRDSPPRSPFETYWQARALQGGGDPRGASQLYAGLWASGDPPSLNLAGTEILSDQVLQRAQAEPANTDLQTKAGLSLMRQSRFAEAVACWERVLNLDSSSNEARQALALCRQETGDWERAAAAWRSLIEQKLDRLKKAPNKTRP